MTRKKQLIVITIIAAILVSIALYIYNYSEYAVNIIDSEEVYAELIDKETISTSNFSAKLRVLLKHEDLVEEIYSHTLSLGFQRGDNVKVIRQKYTRLFSPGLQERLVLKLDEDGFVILE